MRSNLPKEKKTKGSDGKWFEWYDVPKHERKKKEVMLSCEVPGGRKGGTGGSREGQMQAATWTRGRPDFDSLSKAVKPGENVKGCQSHPLLLLFFNSKRKKITTGSKKEGSFSKNSTKLHIYIKNFTQISKFDPKKPTPGKYLLMVHGF